MSWDGLLARGAEEVVWTSIYEKAGSLRSTYRERSKVHLRFDRSRSRVLCGLPYYEPVHRAGASVREDDVRCKHCAREAAKHAVG